MAYKISSISCGPGQRLCSVRVSLIVCAGTALTTMPTATATLSWTLTNWGPLTTSWSLPDSCTSNVALAYTEEPGWIILNEQCSPSPFACLPSPTDSNAPAALSSARNTIGLDIHPDPFYSPALSCPYGWKTVGVASRKGTATASKSGWFTASFEDNLEEIDFADDSPIELNEAIALLLDADETAVACCPRYSHFLLFISLSYFELQLKNSRLQN